ncbi:MerR family DNA-binding transcriptional regulator [Micromonospora parathelypteridis]
MSALGRPRGTTRLDIAEVAERTGMTASALRFYERRGLIARHAGGRP